jgi:hypothetical protein
MKVANIELTFIQVVGGILSAFLTVVVFLAVIGNIFPRTVEAIGLGWMAVPLRGVYADCSRPENQGTGFCQPKEQRYTRDTAYFRSDRIPNRSHGNLPAFGLNDRD